MYYAAELRHQLQQIADRFEDPIIVHTAIKSAPAGDIYTIKLFPSHQNERPFFKCSCHSEQEVENLLRVLETKFLSWGKVLKVEEPAF